MIESQAEDAFDDAEDGAGQAHADTTTATAGADSAAGVAADHPLEDIVEALLLASEAPLTVDQLQRLLGPDCGCDRAMLREALATLADRYAHGACELREVAGGWRLQVRAEYSYWVARLWQEKPQRLSRALMETLALIVYRQPVTRGEIEEVRGVAVSSNILRTLLERGWIRELGHKEVLGRPMLYGSTPQLLDDLNLKSLDQLPELPAVRDAEQLEAALARLGLEPLAAVEGEGEPAAATDLDQPEPAAVQPADTTLHY